MMLLGLAIVAGPAWSADKVPSDRLLPPNVYAYVSIPSVPELKGRVKDSLLGQLREEKALAEFWSDVDAQLERLSEEMEKQVGVKLNDLLELPEGELALAVVQPEGKGLALVGLLDFGDNDSTVDKLLESAAKAAEKEGAKRSEQDVQSTKVTVYTFPKPKLDDDNADSDGQDGAAADAPSRQVAYFIRDSHLVFSTEVAALDSVLTRWDGKSTQTFAENKPYQYIVEQCRTGRTEPALSWYLNPLDLVRALITSGGVDANPQAAMVLGFLPALGVSNLKAVGGSMDLATEEYNSVSHTLLYVEQPTSGILKIFEFPATEQSPPSWVTEDATSYFAFNWDIAGAYGAVEALFDTFQGPGAFAAIIDSFAGQEGGPKIHLKKDVIDQFSGQMHVTSDTPVADEPEKQRYLFAIDVKDADKMKKVLESVAKTQGFPGEVREFHGQTIYEMELPPPVGDGLTKMGICVTSGHLMISNDVTRIDQVILADKDRKPLSQSAEYMKIAKNFPSKTSILGFQRQDSQMRVVYEMLRSGSAGIELEGIDFSKLPPFEAIQKYLPANGSYAIPDKNGAKFVSFVLKSDAK